MPAAADPQTIRAILETDRPWSVYALGDLAPEYRAQARWHVAHGGRPALFLIYNAFHPPVLFAHGAVSDLMPLLPEIADRPAFYLSVRPEMAAVLEAAGYELSAEKRMWRMLPKPGITRPCNTVPYVCSRQMPVPSGSSTKMDSPAARLPYSSALKCCVMACSLVSAKAPP
jgi:hypothetical protein